jgi:hypothetical protein
MVASVGCADAVIARGARTTAEARALDALAGFPYPLSGMTVGFDRWGGTTVVTHDTAPTEVATLLASLGLGPEPDRQRSGDRSLSYGCGRAPGGVAVLWFPAGLDRWLVDAERQQAASSVSTVLAELMAG